MTMIIPAVDPSEMVSRSQVDIEHSQKREGHAITKEREIICRFRVERKSCTCGWRGEWYRIRTTA